MEGVSGRAKVGLLGFSHGWGPALGFWVDCVLNFEKSAGAVGWWVAFGWMAQALEFLLLHSLLLWPVTWVEVVMTWVSLSSQKGVLGVAVSLV